ncbi:hypothetical protein MRX96_037477 [Rhipicephalus microplus]
MRASRGYSVGSAGRAGGGLVGEGLTGGRMDRRGNGIGRYRPGFLVGLSGRLALTAAAEEQTSRHHTCAAALTALLESGFAAVASSVATFRSSCQRGQVGVSAGCPPPQLTQWGRHVVAAGR